MPTRFPLAIRLLHWTMAATLLVMLFIGVGMLSTTGPAYTVLLSWHRPVGLVLLGLAVIRLSIRLGTQAPPLPADLPRLQAAVAQASHGMLYAAMIAMPLIGWAMLSAGGYPVVLAPGVVLPPLVPQDLGLFGLLRLAHTLVSLTLFALILGHLTAALSHAFIRRDGVMSTMRFGPDARRQDDQTDEVPDAANHVASVPTSLDGSDASGSSS